MSSNKFILGFLAFTTALLITPMPGVAAPCAPCSSVIVTFCPYVATTLTSDTEFGKITFLQMGGGTHQIHYCDCMPGGESGDDFCLYRSGVASGGISAEFKGDGTKCIWKNCDDPPDTKICVDVDCNAQGQVTEPIPTS